MIRKRYSTMRREGRSNGTCGLRKRRSFESLDDRYFEHLGALMESLREAVRNLEVCIEEDKKFNEVLDQMGSGDVAPDAVIEIRENLAYAEAMIKELVKSGW